MAGSRESRFAPNNPSRGKISIRFAAILAIALLILIGLSISVSTGEEKTPVSSLNAEGKALNFEFKVLTGTRYVSDFGITYLRDWFIGQTSILSSSKNGLYTAVTTIYVPSRKFNSGEEAGLFDGYAGKEGKLGSINYDAYIGYYAYEIEKSNVEDTGYAGLGFRLPKIGELTPFVGSEYYYVPRQTGQNGFVWRGGIEYAKGNFRTKLFLTGHDRVFGSNSAWVASGIASAEYTIILCQYAKIIPSVNYQQRLEDEERDGGLSQGGFWGAITLKLVF